MKRARTGSEARIQRKSARLATEAAEREQAAIEAERQAMLEEQKTAQEASGNTAPSASNTSADISPGTFAVTDADAGQRLDQFLTAHLTDVSRSRVQLLLEQGKLVLTAASGDLVPADKLRPNYRLRAGEHIELLGNATPPPLKARAQDLPLDIIYEDDDLAVLNKAAGMVVHAGAGTDEDGEAGGGTVVNAILHHFEQVANAADPIRPGIVHRLDKLTSGLLVIAKNDASHTKLSEAFADRKAKKQYVALVHGHVERDRGTVNLPIARDHVRRTRMTTRGRDGRSAITHWTVRERLTTPWGDFTLLDVTIETGRTHQIRVHLSSIGHPIVGDSLYGAPHEIRARELINQPAKKQRRTASRFAAPLHLERNFLHAAKLALPHPRTGAMVEWQAPLAPELAAFLSELKGDTQPKN